MIKVDALCVTYDHGILRHHKEQKFPKLRSWDLYLRKFRQAAGEGVNLPHRH